MVHLIGFESPTAKVHFCASSSAGHQNGEAQEAFGSHNMLAQCRGLRSRLGSEAETMFTGESEAGCVVWQASANAIIQTIGVVGKTLPGR